jgi:hypothetical protein
MKPLNKLWNLAPRNPTQTAMTRFLRGPESGLKSAFSASHDAFEKNMSDRLNTDYDQFWKNGVTK